MRYTKQMTLFVHLHPEIAVHLLMTFFAHLNGSDCETRDTATQKTAKYDIFHSLTTSQKHQQPLIWFLQKAASWRQHSCTIASVPNFQSGPHSIQFNLIEKCEWISRKIINIPNDRMLWIERKWKKRQYGMWHRIYQLLFCYTFFFLRWFLSSFLMLGRREKNVQ